MVSRSVEGSLFSKIVKKEAIATAIKVEAGLKKAISFAETKVKKNRIAAYLLEDLAFNIHTDKWNQLDSGTDVEVIVERDNVDKSKLCAQESVETSISSEFEKSTETFTSTGFEELSMDCLTCANLIGCDFRNNLSAKSEKSSQNIVPCNLANHKGLRVNKQVRQ